MKLELNELYVEFTNRIDMDISIYNVSLTDYLETLANLKLTYERFEGLLNGLASYGFIEWSDANKYIDMTYKYYDNKKNEIF